MSNEMNLYKRCKNIFKAHGVDMGGGGSGGSAPVLEFTWGESGESAGEAIVSTQLTWADIANAVKSNPNTVAHVAYEDGSYVNLPVLMFGESDGYGDAIFALSGLISVGESEEGNTQWAPYGGMLIISYSAEDDEMGIQFTANLGG